MDSRKIAIIILGMLMIMATVDSYQLSRLQNENGEGANLISMYYKYQKIYKDSFGVYVDNAKNLRDCCMSLKNDYKIYFSEKEIPKTKYEKLDRQDLPFLAKNSFRLLLVMESGDRLESMWTIDSRGEARQIFTP